MDKGLLIFGIILWVIGKVIDMIPFLPPPFSIALMIAQMIIPLLAWLFIILGAWRAFKTRNAKFTDIDEDEEENNEEEDTIDFLKFN